MPFRLNNWVQLHHHQTCYIPKNWPCFQYMFPVLDLLNWWTIDTISMIGMKESEWIEIFLPTHNILNLEPCVWRPVWDKWRLVVPSCGAPSQNSGYLEWKVNDCQEAICRENWSNTWAIWKNKAHPWPKKKQSKLQSMSSRCNLWSSGTMVQTARPDWANHCVCVNQV